MVRLLPTPIKGATHVQVDEVVIGIKAEAIIVRGILGSQVNGTFTPDTGLRQVQHAFTGAQALSLAQAMGVASLWTALNNANWGFA